jgi:hypothetical protein
MRVRNIDSLSLSFTGADNQYFGDLWEYDNSAQTWRNLPSTVPARAASSYWSDPKSGQAWIQGGLNETGIRKEKQRGGGEEKMERERERREKWSFSFHIYIHILGLQGDLWYWDGTSFSMMMAYEPQEGGEAWRDAAGNLWLLSGFGKYLHTPYITFSCFFCTSKIIF